MDGHTDWLSNVLFISAYSVVFSSWCGKVTDLHPDNHYIEGSLARTACHHFPDDDHNMTSKFHPVLMSSIVETNGSSTTTRLAQTLIRTIIVRHPTLAFPMDPVILLGRSSTLHSNTSTKSGKIKSISSSGLVTTSGLSPSEGFNVDAVQTR